MTAMTWRDPLTRRAAIWLAIAIAVGYTAQHYHAIFCAVIEHIGK